MRFEVGDRGGLLSLSFMTSCGGKVSFIREIVVTVMEMGRR